MKNLEDNDSKKEKFVDKSVHQTINDSKPVGYGSSIQNSGNGNKTRPQDLKNKKLNHPKDIKEE